MTGLFGTSPVHDVTNAVPIELREAVPRLAIAQEESNNKIVVSVVVCPALIALFVPEAETWLALLGYLKALA